MDNDSVRPRFYCDTFGGSYFPEEGFSKSHDDLDVDENLGFRTPFQDSGMAKVNALFDKILSK